MIICLLTVCLFFSSVSFGENKFKDIATNSHVSDVLKNELSKNKINTNGLTLIGDLSNKKKLFRAVNHEDLSLGFFLKILKVCLPNLLIEILIKDIFINKFQDQFLSFSKLIEFEKQMENKMIKELNTIVYTEDKENDSFFFKIKNKKVYALIGSSMLDFFIKKRLEIVVSIILFIYQKKIIERYVNFINTLNQPIVELSFFQKEHWQYLCYLLAINMPSDMMVSFLLNIIIKIAQREIRKVDGGSKKRERQER